MKTYRICVTNGGGKVVAVERKGACFALRHNDSDWDTMVLPTRISPAALWIVWTWLKKTRYAARFEVPAAEFAKLFPGCKSLEKFNLYLAEREFIHAAS